MTARKTKRKVFTKANDIAQFTLPSPQETASEVKSDTVFSPVDLVPDSSGESIFWHTKKGKIWMSAFGMSIVIALIVGVFIYRVGTTILAPLPVPIEEPQVSPTPTPKEIDISKYKIEILNGSGISGEAAKVKGLLEEEKFTISSIGNGDRLDYQKTIIQAKKTVPKEFLEKLKVSLEKSYALEDVVELSENGEPDIVIIVGREKVSK